MYSKPFCAIFCLVLLVSACSMSREISNALYDREFDELTQNSVVEYIIEACVGTEDASEIDQATGAAIKSKMQALRPELSQIFGEKAIVRQPDEGLLMVLPSDMLFKSGRKELKESVLPSLVHFAQWMSSQPDLRCYLLVHTDNNSSEYISLALSEQRAKSLRKVLKKNGMKHLYTAGKGTLVPVITNESEEGRQLNRRVEIAIVASRELIKTTRKDIKKDIRKSNN